VLFSALLVGTARIETVPAAVFAAATAWLATMALDRPRDPAAATAA
jgi:hypothetical protein